MKNTVIIIKSGMVEQVYTSQEDQRIFVVDKDIERTDEAFLLPYQTETGKTGNAMITEIDPTTVESTEEFFRSI